MNIVFTSTSWEQYTDWQREDKKMVKRINELIKDIDEAMYYCTVVKAMEDGQDVSAFTVDTATHRAIDTGHGDRISVNHV